MKKWTLSLVLLLGAWLLPAQNTAMLFLPVNRDAATVGGAQALSSLYNPAAIPFTGSDVQLSYQRWAPSVASANHLNLLSGIRIGKRVGVGLTVGYQMGEEFALTDGSFFMPSDLLVGLGAGVAFTDYLSLGVKAKYARQGLTKEIAAGVMRCRLRPLWGWDMGLRSGCLWWPIPISTLPGALLLPGACSMPGRTCSLPVRGTITVPPRRPCLRTWPWGWG